MVEYSIIIPTYNESANITSSLTQVMAFMPTFAKSFEVLVVDDGSNDNTRDLVKAYAKTSNNIRLIENPHKGKGPTVWKGVSEASGKYIYFADADLSAPITELKKLSVWMIDHDYDVVIASREGIGAERVDEPFYRHLMGRVFNLWVRMLALPGIKDSQCGFKLFKGDAAKQIFSKLHIYGESAREIKKPYLGAFDVEVLYIAKKLGYKIKSVPVTWTFVKTQRLNTISDSINMPIDVLRVKINDLRKMYS